jgi:predicted AAA+ superfamily ATPase
MTFGASETNLSKLYFRQSHIYRSLRIFGFVVSDGGKPVELIQVSYDISTQKTRNKELNGLLAGAKALKCDKLTLITFDTAETVTMGDKTIEIVSATDWLCQR